MKKTKPTPGAKLIQKDADAKLKANLKASIVQAKAKKEAKPPTPPPADKPRDGYYTNSTGTKVTVKGISINEHIMGRRVADFEPDGRIVFAKETPPAPKAPVGLSPSESAKPATPAAPLTFPQKLSPTLTFPELTCYTGRCSASDGTWLDDFGRFSDHVLKEHNGGAIPLRVVVEMQGPGRVVIAAMSALLNVQKGEAEPQRSTSPRKK